MQSRIAASTAAVSNRIFPSAPVNQSLTWRLASASIGRTADPAIHAGDPEGGYAEEAAKAAMAEDQPGNKHKKGNKSQPLMRLKPPLTSSHELASDEVISHRKDLITHQKRRSTTRTPTIIEEMSCEGLDGSPWPEETEDRRTQRRKQEMEDKEYFQHHKASPLSEIEVKDTRKPITQATDGTAGSYYSEGGEGVLLWRPEQLDTAEDSLRRAVEIWRQNAMRGDPDTPHGRVLRALRGEYW